MLIYLGRRGGTATYAFELSKALSKLTNLVVVISKNASNAALWKKEKFDLVEIKTFNNLFECILSSFNITKFLRLKKRIEDFSPDVIYYPRIHLWTPLINYITPGIPKVITVHEFAVKGFKQNIFTAQLEKFSIKQAERIILLSKVFVSELTKKGIDESRIDIIPHGEFSFYTKMNTVQERSSQEPTILFFGRITPFKGLDVLLKAFILIRQKVSNSRLLIVGEGNMEPYRNLIRDLDGIEAVNCWVNDEAVRDYFAEADLVALPYLEASQSGVIPIAYSMKLPVVATSVGGIPEQVENGRTGLLVSPDNVEELASACISLLNNKVLAQEFGENGYKKALVEWNWDSIAKKTFNNFVLAVESDTADQL